MAPTRTLAVFDEPLTTITSALLVGNRLKDKYPTWEYSLGHSETFVPTARTVRTERLAEFLAADAAAQMLFNARLQKLERPVAVEMISTLFSAIGIKPGEDSAGMLAGSLDMIESDEIARASGLWRPLAVSPAILALACRKLIATAKWVKPCELRVACDEAGTNLMWAQQAADGLVDYVRRADAILLAFAPDEWRVPYQTPQFRPVLELMLEKHEIYGDGTDEADWEDNQFRALVACERDKLLAIEAPAKRRLAASRVRPVMKTKKPRTAKP